MSRRPVSWLTGRRSGLPSQPIIGPVAERPSLAAYSCGGSCGFGLAPHRIPVSPWPIQGTCAASQCRVHERAATAASVLAASTNNGSVRTRQKSDLWADTGQSAPEKPTRESGYATGAGVPTASDLVNSSNDGPNGRVWPYEGQLPGEQNGEAHHTVGGDRLDIGTADGQLGSWLKRLSASRASLPVS